MSQDEIHARAGRAQRRQRLRKPFSTEVVCEQSGQRHQREARECRKQPNGKYRRPIQMPRQARKRGNQRRLIHIASGHMLAARPGVHLVAEAVAVRRQKLEQQDRARDVPDDRKIRW